MQIILVRHAHAEERREDLEDIKRHLTKEGKEIFKRLMPELKERLQPIAKQKLLLWSSPANRAMETAEIVAEALDLSVDTIEGFIYEGDFKTLSSWIQDVADDALLMVVGHEPALSEWAKEITGERMKIRKGDLLQFEVTQKFPLKAELQWKISSK